MRVFRRRLAWVVCGWLCCQLSVLTAAPLSLFASAPNAANPMSCTCVHTGNAQCPMHHPATPTSNCQCRNTTDPGAATLVSLLGPAAVLPAPVRSLAPPTITPTLNHHITRFVSVVTPPDGPPPRA